MKSGFSVRLLEFASKFVRLEIKSLIFCREIPQFSELIIKKSKSLGPNSLNFSRIPSIFSSVFFEKHEIHVENACKTARKSRFSWYFPYLRASFLKSKDFIEKLHFLQVLSLLLVCSNNFPTKFSGRWQCFLEFPRNFSLFYPVFSDIFPGNYWISLMKAEIFQDVSTFSSFCSCFCCFFQRFSSSCYVFIGKWLLKEYNKIN